MPFKPAASTVRKREARRRDQFGFQRPVRARNSISNCGARLPARAQFLRHRQGRKDVPARSARDHQNACLRRGITFAHHDSLNTKVQVKSQNAKGKSQNRNTRNPRPSRCYVFDVGFAFQF